MQVILTERVPNLGNKGAVVDVATGYAQNYLFKKNLAIHATKAALANAEKMRAEAVAKAEEVMENAKEIAESLKGATLMFKQKAQGDKLYGSIKAKDITDALVEQKKVEIKESMVEIKDAIKTTGEHAVTLKLTDKVSVDIKVMVEEEK